MTRKEARTKRKRMKKPRTKGDENTQTRPIAVAVLRLVAVDGQQITKTERIMELPAVFLKLLAMTVVSQAHNDP